MCSNVHYFVNLINVSYKYRQFLFFLVKLAIVLAAFYFIFQKTVHNKVLSLSDFMLQLEKTILNKPNVIGYLFLFTLFNWFFEILKWKNLVKYIKSITFFTAFKQSLGSLTASLFTPNRVGEYGAKAFYFYKKDRKKVLLLNLISNMSQMTATLIFGLFGLIYIMNNFDVHLPIFKLRKLLYYATILILSLVGGKFFISKKIRGFYWNKILSFLKHLPKTIAVKTILFSVIRYLIFSHQFYYLLMLFGVEVEYVVLMKLIFAMYLFASMIPSLPMFDFLIKGSVAVFVFSMVGINELIVVTTTTTMWLFNFAFPAIIGSYFVMNFKFISYPKNN